jgi:hypothetical protein
MPYPLEIIYYRKFSACYDLCHADGSIWYPLDSNDLCISLMFKQKADALIHWSDGKLLFYKKFRIVMISRENLLLLL